MTGAVVATVQGGRAGDAGEGIVQGMRKLATILSKWVTMIAARDAATCRQRVDTRCR